MMKNIEEFSVSFQEKEDTRDFWLKYKLLIISLMFLIESSNQYFYRSARSEPLDGWSFTSKLFFL